MKNTIKTRFHRAFTIVELVIVIAVIAILAAVLIPTFANVIDAANESNDMVLVRNLNLSLSAADAPDKVTTDGAENGVYNVTTAITSIRADGYDVSKLTPTADGGDIVYNASTNKFIYYTDDFTDLAYGDEPSADDVLVVMDTDLTRVGIAEDVLTDNTIQYCVYSENGVDISTDEEINIWLYTERGTTTVSAANATIDYFGTAEVIDITEVKDDSFHVYGTVESLSVTKGHVELKSTSKTSSLKITSDDVKLTIVKGAEYEEVAAVNGVSYTLCTKESDDAESQAAADVETTLAEMKGDGSTFVSTLTLSENTTMTDALTVSSGVNKVIDLNGNTLTISGTSDSSNIVNNGTLTITDSSTAKTGSLVVNTATYGIKNNGTLTIKSGTIEGKKVIYLNNSSASLYMTGGTITSDVNSGSGIDSEKSLNTIITGGSISATGTGTSCAIYVKNCSGTTAISNVTISSSTSGEGIYLEAGSSDVTIEGVTVKDNADTGFWIVATNSGTVYIKDCNVSADDETTSFSSCALSLVGNVVVDGGTYRGDKVLCVLFDNPTIKSGTFIGKISVDGSLTITGGTYYSADPTSYVDTNNYTVSGDSSTYYTVTAKSESND